MTQKPTHYPEFHLGQRQIPMPSFCQLDTKASMYLPYAESADCEHKVCLFT